MSEPNPATVVSRPNGTPSSRESTTSRDVVLVTFDCWRYDAIDRMDGLTEYAEHDDYVVTDAVCQAASTWFAMPIIHSSRYPMDAYTEAGTLAEDVVPLARVLSDEGYSTGAFVGSNPYANLWTGGFDEFWNGGLEKDPEDRSVLERLWTERNLYRLNYALLRERTSMSEVIDEAREWYANADGPRFLWVHFMDTHEPYLPGLRSGLEIGLFDVYRAFYRHHRDSASMSDSTLKVHRELYERTLDRIDDTVTDLFSFIDRDATVVVTGDHGQEIERGIHGHARMYEEVVRVPFLVRWTLDRDLELPDGPVRQIDVAPTILDGLEIDRPRSWVGEPFDGERRDSYSIGDYDYFGSVYTALRTGRYKIMKTFDVDTRQLEATELYDLQLDPGERNDRYPDGERARELEAKLDEFLDGVRFDIYSYPPEAEQRPEVVEERLRELGYLE